MKRKKMNKENIDKFATSSAHLMMEGAAKYVLENQLTQLSPEEICYAIKRISKIRTPIILKEAHETYEAVGIKHARMMAELGFITIGIDAAKEVQGVSFGGS